MSTAIRASVARNGKQPSRPETWDAVPWTVIEVSDPDLGDYMIEVAIVVLTTTLARAFLVSELNRPLSRQNLGFIVDDILGDNFKFTGEPIIFDEEGRGRNGQHRCHAVIKTGRPIVTLAIRGIDADAFDYMDRNKVRSNADVLGIHNEKAYCLLASAAAYMWRLDNGLLHTPKGPRPDGTLETVKRHPLLRDGCAFANDPANRTRLLPGGIIAFFYAAALEACGDRDSVEAFLKAICTGADVPNGSPVFLLRRLLENDIARPSRMPGTLIVAYLIKTWNTRRIGKSVKFLKYVPDVEPYPTIRRED